MAKNRPEAVETNRSRKPATTQRDHSVKHARGCPALKNKYPDKWVACSCKRK